MTRIDQPECGEWWEQVEAVMERFDQHKICFPEAVKELKALGFSEREAETEVLRSAAA